MVQRNLETEQLNDTTIYILPLLVHNIISKSELLNKRSGFINAYLEDINRPYLEDKLLIIIKIKNTVECYDLMDKFEALDIYHSKYYTRINRERYMIYVFTLLPTIKKEVNKLKCHDCVNLLFCSKCKIIDFWENKSSGLESKNLFNVRRIDNIHYKPDVIPEEDYLPNLKL